MSATENDSPAGCDSFGEKTDLPDVYTRLNSLPPEVQAVISGFSSYFLEKDVREQFEANPNNSYKLLNQFQQLGFPDEAIDVAFCLLGFRKPQPPVTDV